MWLEETRDTITVPASFMIRILASLNSIRNQPQQHGTPPLPAQLPSRRRAASSSDDNDSTDGEVQVPLHLNDAFDDRGYDSE